MAIRTKVQAEAERAQAEIRAKSDLILSPQQIDILAWVRTGRGSAFVEAVAGAGKTTTLIEACKHMSGSVAFAAFNKKIATEIQRRLEPLGLNNVRAGTFHSFGYSAWRRVARDVRVDDREKRRQMLDACRVHEDIETAVSKLVSIAKQSCNGLLWKSDQLDVWETTIDHYDLMFDVDDAFIHRHGETPTRNMIVDHAIAAIEWSRERGEDLIDFDDMIWLPVTTEGTRFWENDWILVDEAQDTNPARREMARRMLRRGGRSLWVGDRHQAIYGFTGADSDAVDRIVEQYGCVHLPLTVTYRCPKSVVEIARRYVSHITAHETAEQGEVRGVTAREFDEKEAQALKPGDAILCRITRPLVSLAFSLIRRGIGCHVEGRDIGQGLIKLATKWKVETVAALNKNLDAYLKREIEKLERKGEGSKYAIEALTDRVETLRIVMEDCDTVQCVRDKIERMFRDTEGKPNTVTLSTVHKAKGREWSRVYVLGWAQYMPSKWATQDWQIEQERNLIYVAVTRSKRELALLDALDKT